MEEKLITCTRCKEKFRVSEAEMEAYGREELGLLSVLQHFKLRCPHCKRIGEYTRTIPNRVPKKMNSKWRTDPAREEVR